MVHHVVSSGRCSILSVKTMQCAIYSQHSNTEDLTPLTAEGIAFIQRQTFQTRGSQHPMTVLLEGVKTRPCCLKRHNFEGLYQFQSSPWDGSKRLSWLHQVRLLLLPSLASLPSQVLIPRGLPENLHLRLHFPQDTTHSFNKSLFTKPFSITNFECAIFSCSDTDRYTHMKSEHLIKS